LWSVTRATLRGRAGCCRCWWRSVSRRTRSRPARALGRSQHERVVTVGLEPDEGVALESAHLDVVDPDGTAHAVSVDSVAGSPARPLSDADLLGKLRDVAAGVLTDELVDEIAQTTLGLDRCADVRDFVRLLRLGA